MQHLWYNSTLFYQQDKVGGIIPTYEKFCLPQNDKRETRFINNGFAFNILKKKFLYELR